MVIFHPFGFSPFLSWISPAPIMFFKESILYLRFTGQKSIMITMYIFVFTIPRSYTVSIGKAASRRHGAEGRQKAEAGHPPRWKAEGI